jgi:hypothetical protein
MSGGGDGVICGGRAAAVRDPTPSIDSAGSNRKAPGYSGVAMSTTKHAAIRTILRDLMEVRRHDIVTSPVVADSPGFLFLPTYCAAVLGVAWRGCPVSTDPRVQTCTLALGGIPGQSCRARFRVPP